MKKISVIGQGKVGFVLSACLVNAGYEVIAADVSADLVKAINDGTHQTDEPRVMEMLRDGKGSLRATTNTEEVILNTDFTFVIVPTPSNTLGGFSNRFVLASFKAIGEALAKKSDYHVVALVSTVLPGSSLHLLIPALEEASGKKAGKDFGYCYNPAFIALGEVSKGFVTPDFVLIGQSDERAGGKAAAVHGDMIETERPMAIMGPTEAEITKIASNTHETMRVSFANMLFSVCSETPNTNVDRITGALSHRMGKRFFKGAVPYGGPCWPRDNVALAQYMDAIGVPSIMPRTVDQFNDAHAKYVLRKILEMSRQGESVGLLGMAYKPGTPVIEESFAVKLAEWLLREGRTVEAWDPMALDEVRKVLGDRISYCDSGDECLARSSVSVVLNPLPELPSLNWGAARDNIVIDCWRVLPGEAVDKLANYRPLGVGDNGTRDLMDKIGAERFRLLTN